MFLMSEINKKLLMFATVMKSDSSETGYLATLSDDSIDLEGEIIGKGLLENALDKNRTGMPAEKVANVIIRALEAPKPKTRYVLGKERGLLLLAKFLPDRILDKLRIRVSGLSGIQGKT